MKRILLALALTGFLTTGSMAAVLGKVIGVTTFNTGVIKVRILPDNGGDSLNREIRGTPDSIKAMLALALTAKSTNSTVSLTGSIDQGVIVWDSIAIQ